MKVWYSICWQPRDYNNSNSFIELDGCPRFYLSENGKPVDKGMLENQFPSLQVKEVFKTEIFMQDENGNPMPTHYRYGIFMPHQNKSYDVWLQKSFKINAHILEKVKARQELFKKNMFLEYASKIIRHDMHSGINTYIPRGLKSLKAKLTDALIKKHKLGMGLKLLENGLQHTQQVYQGVYAFTNLVREQTVLEKDTVDLKNALTEYLSLTAYHKQVQVDDLPIVEANRSLMCTALDNIIRNGLKYNDHKPNDKLVRVFQLDEMEIGIQDNGRGMTQQEFDGLSQPYKRKQHQKESGSGLGLHICIAIFEEHGFTIRVEKNEIGTLVKVKLI